MDASQSHSSFVDLPVERYPKWKSVFLLSGIQCHQIWSFTWVLGFLGVAITFSGCPSTSNMSTMTCVWEVKVVKSQYSGFWSLWENGILDAKVGPTRSSLSAFTLPGVSDRYKHNRKGIERVPPISSHSLLHFARTPSNDPGLDEVFLHLLFASEGSANDKVLHCGNRNRYNDISTIHWLISTVQN